MSDLAATNCGCGGDCGCNTGFGGCNSCIWIIILLLLCGGDSGFLGTSGCGGGCNGGGCGSNSCIWIILLLFCCGGCGGGCNGGGCGC